MKRVASFVLFFLAVAACGGDDDEVPDEIQPASDYAGRCEKPRVGRDTDGRPFPDEDGSLLDEQLWLRSWTDDTYLWYQEVPRANPKQFDTAVAYFEILKTGVKTASGRDKDRFHFEYTTEEWTSLSQSGVSASYGVNWAVVEPEPPRVVVVAYVEPGSPAAAANIKRGALVVTIDGEDVANGSRPDILNDGLLPHNAGETHTFVLQDQGAPTTRTVMLAAASLTSTPVQTFALPAPNDKVGYMLFNDHIATAEKGLVDEITKLKAAGVTDLVLDMRYNGGGYLAIASEIAYMIAGPTSAGKTFDQLQFNDKHPTTDPVTGQVITPEPFLSQSQGFSVDPGMALPYLDLPIKRVFILTSFNTASASEAVMNGLAGIDVQVIQVGTTTRGKPYGFYPTDNCGITYFSIQFQGANAKGYGDYPDGLIPGQQNVGCIVADDFTHQLGDPLEAQLAAALTYAKTGKCPEVALLRARDANPLASVTDAVVPKPLWLQSSILRR